MSIELRNRLEDSLQVTLSATLIWNYPTVRILTSFLAEKIGIVFEDEDEPAEAASSNDVVNAGQTTDPDIDNLPRDELDALLQEELDALEDLLGDH